MKHIKVVSSEMPAKALLVDDHPGIVDSLKGFIMAPVQVLQDHVGYLTDKS